MAAARRPEQRGIRGAFASFVHSEVSGSIVLLACTVTALTWANSPWAESYFHLLHIEVGVSWGGAGFALSLQHWINDFLMALFFFVVGLEIKREVVVGHLSSVGQAALPVSAAIGGMVAPAVLYLVLNPQGEPAQGWGIPMATDIAFALGILALFGRRVPLALKVFLTALAIADDIGAVMVIALFYTEQIVWLGLAEAALALGLLFFVTRILRVRRIGIVLALVIAAWIGVFLSGIHATVAGILVALVVPVKAQIEPRRFFEVAHARLEELRASAVTTRSMLSNAAQLDAIKELHDSIQKMRPPGLALEEYFHPVSAFFVLPLFAFFNAGVAVGEGVLAALMNPVSLGIILGLFAGKQIGITALSWLAIRLGAGRLPEGVTWMQIYGAGCLAGVGFTMSLFISDLAFADPALVTQAKIGILGASLLAGIWGWLVLQLALPKASQAEAAAEPAAATAP